MNILSIIILFVGFMVSEIPRVSVFVIELERNLLSISMVFGHCPYSVTFP